LIITGEPGNVLKRGARGEANGEAASDAKILLMVRVVRFGSHKQQVSDDESTELHECLDRESRRISAIRTLPLTVSYLCVFHRVLSVSSPVLVFSPSSFSSLE
jgi:hypothetical protein